MKDFLSLACQTLKCSSKLDPTCSLCKIQHVLTAWYIYFLTQPLSLQKQSSSHQIQKAYHFVSNLGTQSVCLCAVYSFSAYKFYSDVSILNMFICKLFKLKRCF